MLNKYLVFIDKRFSARSRKELSALAKDHKITDQHERFVVIQTKLNREKMFSAINKNKPIFIEKIIPVTAFTEYKSQNYSKIINSIAKSIGENTSFRIEALNLQSGSGENAKRRMLTGSL